MGIVEEQLKKLLKGKVILVLEEADLEHLIQAAVPGLEVHADQADEGETWTDRVAARRMRALADELDKLPKVRTSPVANITTYLH